MMASEIRWAVLRDRYPFAIGDLLGYVDAPDRTTALEEACARFPGRVLVQSAASRTAEARERPLSAPDPTRDAYGLKKRPHRGQARRPKARGPHDPRGPRPEPMGEEVR